MKFKLEKPRQVRQALCGKKGWNLAIEILIAVLVFFVCAFAQMIIILPAELVMLFRDEDYLTAAISGNVSLALEAEEIIMSSDVMMIVSLFSDIMMILVILGFCRLFQRRNPASVGFTRKHVVLEYLIGFVVGFVMFSAAVLVNVVSGAMKVDGLASEIPAGILILFFLGYMIQGMAEEVLCRGYLMISVARRYPMWVGVLVNSILFAALHLANNGITVLAFINLVLFGIFASVYYIRRGSIWGIGAIHSMWNFTQGNFYGISVSGTGDTSSVLTSTMVDGKGLINGGAFGSEGGLAVTIVLVIGILALYFGENIFARKEQAAPIKTVLFDLDGTLLPMDQDQFVNSYFKALAGKLAPLGYDAKKLVDGIWDGTNAMVANDGGCTNEEAFWKKFAEYFGERVYEDQKIFEEFYRNEFNMAASVCSFNSKALETVQNLKNLEIPIGLATNPIFPRIATENRIRWVRLEPSDFMFYTTYEDCRYCKPNPEYYREILQKYDLKPEECLMIGNDVSEDMVAETLGMKVFLLTDCLINKNQEDISGYPHGNFNKLMLYLAETVV